MTGRAMRTVVSRRVEPGRTQQVIGGAHVFLDGPDAFIDTLECGHVVTRYTRAIRRSCPECKEDPPSPPPPPEPPPNVRARARGCE